MAFVHNHHSKYSFFISKIFANCFDISIICSFVKFPIFSPSNFLSIVIIFSVITKLILFNPFVTLGSIFT